MPLDERTLAEALRAAGYATVMVGKWHLGHHEPAYLPRGRGFDHHYGIYTGIVDHFQHRYYQGLDWHRDGEPLREEGWATTLMGQEAARRVEQHDFAAKPLFLYFAPLAPHAPPQPTPELLAGYDESFGDEMRRKHAAMVTGMDDAIGLVVAALERKGVLDRTLIVFASDNGGAPALGSRNEPLRGEKDQLWEGGVRVPALAHWPGVLPAGGAVEVPLHVTDLYPTLLARAGASAEQPEPVDGLDAWPAIARGEALPREEMLINLMGRQSAIRVGDWKLVRTSGEVELFDLSRDPGEKRNLARSQPDRLDQMQSRLLAWQQQAARPLGPYPQTLPPGFRIPTVWGDPTSPPAPIGRAASPPPSP
jgi:arylsulfatase A-like enzyme